MWRWNQTPDRPTRAAKELLSQELSNVQRKITLIRRQREMHYADWRSDGEQLESLGKRENEIKTALAKLT